MVFTINGEKNLNNVVNEKTFIDYAELRNNTYPPYSFLRLTDNSGVT